jgi:hypothetical protein
LNGFQLISSGLLASGHAKRLCHIDNKQISRPHGFSQIQPSPTRADFADSYGSHPCTPFHTAAYGMRIAAPGSLRLYRTFVLYAVVPQMDRKCAATLVRIDILQNDFAHRHDPMHDHQMHSAQISLPFPVFVEFCSIIPKWTKILQIFKQIRIVFIFSKIYSI